MRGLLISAGLLLSIVAFSVSLSAQRGFPDPPVQSRAERDVESRLDRRDIAGALTILDSLIERGEELVYAYKRRVFVRSAHLKDADGALADLDEWEKLEPENQSIYLQRAAILRIDKKDLEGAIRAYDKALEASSGNMPAVSILTLRSGIKRRMGNIAGAIADLDAAIDASPDDPSPRVMKADLILEQRSAAEAISYLQGFLNNYVEKRNGKLPKLRGISVSKRGPSDRTGLGGLPVRRYSSQSIEAGSREELDRIYDEQAQAGKLARAYLFLGKLYTAENDIENGLKSFDTAIYIDPNFDEAYGLRGVIFLTRGEYQKAVREFDRAIRIADEPQYYLNRGLSYMMLRRDRQAQRDFDKFLQIYPGGAAVLAERKEMAQKQLAAQTK